MESEPVKKFTKCSDCKYLAYDTFWKIDDLLVCGDCAEDRKRLEPPSKKRRKKRKEELVKIPQEQPTEEVDDSESKKIFSRLLSKSNLSAHVQTSEDIRMEKNSSERPGTSEKDGILKVKKPDVQEEKRPLIVRLKLGNIAATTSITTDEPPSRKLSIASNSPTAISRKRSQQSTSLPTLDKYPSGSTCQDKPTSESSDPPPSLIIEAVPFTSTILERPHAPPATRSSSTNNSSGAFPSVFNKDASLDKLYGLCSNPDCKEGLYDEIRNRDDDILCYECWKNDNHKKSKAWQRQLDILHKSRLEKILSEREASNSLPGPSKHSDEASPNPSDPDFLEVMCSNESPSPSSSSGCSMPSLSPVSSRSKSLEEPTELLLGNLEGRKNPELKECPESRKSREPRKITEVLRSSKHRKSMEPIKNPESKMSSNSTESSELLKSLEVLKSPEPKETPVLVKSSEQMKSSVLAKIPERKKNSGLQKSHELSKSFELNMHPFLRRSPRLPKIPNFFKSPDLTKTPEPTQNSGSTKRYELRKRAEPSQETPSPAESEEPEPNPKLKKLLEGSAQPENSTLTQVNRAEELCAFCKRPFRTIRPQRICHPETHEIICPACYLNFETTRKFEFEQLQNPKFQNTMTKLRNEPEYPPRRSVNPIQNYFDSPHFQKGLERFQKETEKRMKEGNEPRKGECRDLVEDGRPRCNNHFCRVLLGGSGYAHPVTRRVVCHLCYKYFKIRRSDRKENPAYNEMVCEEHLRTWCHPTTNKKCCYMCFKNVVWHLRRYIEKSAPEPQKLQNPVMNSPIGASRPLFSTARLLPFNDPNYRFIFPEFFNIYPTVQNMSAYPQKNGDFFISSSYRASVMEDPQRPPKLGRLKSPPEVIVLDDNSDSEEKGKNGPVRQEEVKKSSSFRIADLIDLKESGTAKENGKTAEQQKKLAGISTQNLVEPARNQQKKQCFTPNCKAILTPSRQFYLHGSKNWICCACYRAYLENELKKVAEVEKMETEQNAMQSKDDNNELTDVVAIDDTATDSPRPSCSDTVSPELLEKDGEISDDDNTSVEDFSDEDSDLLASMDNAENDDDLTREGVAQEGSGGKPLIEVAETNEMDMGALGPAAGTIGENQEQVNEMDMETKHLIAEGNLEKNDAKSLVKTKEDHRKTDEHPGIIGEADMKIKGDEQSNSPKAATDKTIVTMENGKEDHEESSEKLVNNKSFEETEYFSDEDLDWLDQEYNDNNDNPNDMLREAETHEQGDKTELSPTKAPAQENFEQEPSVENTKYEEAKESRPGTPYSSLSDESFGWMESDEDDSDELVLAAAQNHQRIDNAKSVHTEKLTISDKNLVEVSPLSQYSEDKNHGKPEQINDIDETGSQCSDDSIPVIEDFSFSDFDEEDPEEFINNYHDPMDVPESQDARISANEAAFENAMEAEYDEYGDRNPLSPVFATNDVPVDAEEGDEHRDGALESEDSSSSSSDSSDDDSSSDENSDY